MSEAAEPRVFRREPGALVGGERPHRLAQLPGGDWLKATRAAALDGLAAKGLPTRRDEAWKYTDVGALGVGHYHPAEAPPATARTPGAKAGPALADGILIGLANGFVVTPGPDLLPPGLTITRLDAALGDAGGGADARARLGRILPEQGKSFAALNTAMFADGVFVHLAAGTVLDRPIELVSLGEGATGEVTGGEVDGVSFHPRCLVVLEDGAQATLLERHCGQGRYFSNAVTEVALGEGSVLRHYKLQDEAEGAVHVAALGITLGRQSRYQGVVLHAGGRLARHEVHAGLDGAGAAFSLDGATLAGGRQHVDNTTFVTHRAIGAESRQVFKAVLDDHAKGVFQGCVLVEREAQKTNAYQLSKALLLSTDAEMDGKPELEIYADDVKCGHGATVGDIDERALFYLRARGIDEETARGLLIEAFLAEVLEQVESEPVRAAFARVIGGSLSGAHLNKGTVGEGTDSGDGQR